MDTLYNRDNILWVTRDPAEAERENTVLVPTETNRPAALLELIRSHQTEARASIIELVNALKSFNVYQIDAERALRELQEERSVMLKEIPILIGFKTSQFKDIVQFHNPSDPSRDGKSVTFFLDRYDHQEESGERTESVNFLMGGYGMLAFERSNTLGNPPDNLTPGNEHMLTPHRYHFYDTPARIQDLLVGEGFCFEEPTE